MAKAVLEAEGESAGDADGRRGGISRGSSPGKLACVTNGAAGPLIARFIFPASTVSMISPFFGAWP
jgi:hypothetical protein